MIKNNLVTYAATPGGVLLVLVELLESDIVKRMMKQREEESK
jgi:hypothetical protein